MQRKENTVMVKQEWKSLWRNKILMIVLVFIIAIPAIYTTLFLGSMWDPYGKLDELPVAVVNLDEPFDFLSALYRYIQYGG